MDWLRLLMNEAGGEGDPGAGGGGEPALEPGDGGEGEQPPEGAPAANFEAKYLKQTKLNRDLQRTSLSQAKQMKELQAKLDEISGRDKLWDEDPAKAMEARGLKLSDIQRRILESDQVSDEERERLQLRQELDELKTARQREQEERERTETEGAVRKFVGQIQEQLDAAEDFAYSAVIGRAPEIYKRLTEEYRETGESPDDDRQAEIAAEVEQEARTAVHQQVGDLLKKSPAFRQEVQQLLTTLEEQTSEETEPDQQAEKVETRARTRARPRTITRAQQTAVGGRTSKRRETFEERKARLLAGS